MQSETLHKFLLEKNRGYAIIIFEEEEKLCSACYEIVKLTEFTSPKQLGCKKCVLLSKHNKYDPNTHRKCTGCKLVKTNKVFDKKSTTGEFLNRCTQCNMKHNSYMENNRCEHGVKYRNKCKKCNGISICTHGKSKSYCASCGGASLCTHGKRKDRCKECKHLYGLHQYCEHDSLKTSCKRCLGGSICEHGVRRTRCKLCLGGSICEHFKQRHKCILCQGNSTCIHKKQKNNCSICDPIGHLACTVRCRVYDALKGNKEKHTVEYLGCDIRFYKEFLEKKFTSGMSWENYGTHWEIDHIIPIKYKNPTIKDVEARLHYTNTQPLWSYENASKGNRYVSRLQEADPSDKP